MLSIFNFLFLFLFLFFILYFRRQWTEFNVPMMAVGCGSLGMLLLIFIYIISTHVYSYSVMSMSEDSIERKERVKGHENENENENYVKENKENNSKNNRNDGIQFTKDNDEEKESTENAIERNNMIKNSYSIKILLEIMGESVYFTTVLFMSLFHAVSSFSNSFIIEVIAVKCVCVCMCVCVLYIYMYIFMHIHIYVCVCVRACVCVHVSILVCVYVCVHSRPFNCSIFTNLIYYPCIRSFLGARSTLLFRTVRHIRPSYSGTYVRAYVRFEYLQL